MKNYHKIQTIFKRDPETKLKNLLIGEYSLPEFKYLKDCEWVFTEKVDGTNIRTMWDGEKITFGGKTDNSKIPSFLIEKLQERFLSKKDVFVEKFGTDGNVCLYGEGYGNKIQKVGSLYRQDNDFVLFDIKIGDLWLQRKDCEEIANIFGLDIVPIIGKGTLSDAIKMTEKGFNSLWGDFTAEGIVARPSIELRTGLGHRIITKIKHKDFNSPTGRKE